MKKMLLVLFLLPLYIYSQEYNIKITNFDFYEWTDDSQCGNAQHLKIKIHYANGTSENVYCQSCGNSNDLYSDTSWNLDINRNKKPTKFTISAYIREKSGWICEGNTCSFDYSRNLSICDTGHLHDYCRHSDAEIELDFDYEITPIVNLSISTTATDIDQPITLNASTGFPASVYNWEYRIIEENIWLPLSSYNGNSSITITPRDLISGNTNNCDVGLEFRLKDMCGRGISNTQICNVQDTNLPRLVSLTPVDNSCDYLNDGGFILNFDRSLSSNYELHVLLYDVDFPTSAVVNDVITLPNGSTSYTWVSSDHLNKPDIGFNYFIKYYIINNGLVSCVLENNNSFSISNPPPVNFTLDTQNNTCFNGNDGFIVINASGGSGNGYQYNTDVNNLGIDSSWINFTNGNHIPFNTGNYDIYIRDSNHCFTELPPLPYSFDIEKPISAFTFNSFIEQHNPTANGFSDGYITVSASGGWGNYTDVIWSPQPIGSEINYDAVSNSFTLSHIPSGTYTLTVTDKENVGDNNGCTIQTQSIILTEPPALLVNIEITNPISCNTGNTCGCANPYNDGELTAHASGGVPFPIFTQDDLEYEYIWEKQNISGVWEILPTQITDVASGLDQGNYAVNIIDRNGITIGNYQYNLTTSQYELIQSNDVTQLLAEPQLLEVNLTKTDVFCFEGNDGSISAIITGGSGNSSVNNTNFSISWSSSVDTNFNETTQNISDLLAGEYTITVTDTKGCQTVTSIEITQPESPINISYTRTEPTFFGANNGQIVAIISGGTPFNGGSYDFLWVNESSSDLVNQVSSTVLISGEYQLTLSNIPAGSYFLTIRDANFNQTNINENCTISQSIFELEEPRALTVELLENSPISCNSANIYNDPYSDGVLIANGDGGVSLDNDANNGLPYFFTWKKLNSFGVWEILTSQTTNLATELSAGEYAVFVTDANGNVSPEVTFTLEEPLLLNINFDKQDVYCIGGSDAWINVSIYDGTPSLTGEYEVKWYKTNDLNTIIGSNALIEGLEAGNYTVSITDDRGCQIEGSIDIFEPNNPITITYTAFDIPSSSGVSDAWIEAQIQGGTSNIDGSYNFNWSDNTGNILNSQVTSNFVGTSNNIFQLRLNNISSGTYYLTIYDTNYNDASTNEGCISESEYVINEPIEAEIAVYLPISCNQENSFNNPFGDGQLIATVTGGVPFTTGLPYIYHWKKENENGIYIDLPTQNTEIAINLTSGNYALNVEDSLGNIIGTYQGSVLLESMDTLFTFNEPDLLEINFETTPISCEAGNDGTITSTITGGIAPYTIEWSNGESSVSLENLVSGTYIAYVTDIRGCEVIGQITIEQPGDIEITVINQLNPTCFGGNNGSIELEVNGGEAPLTYQWVDTDNTTTSIENLSEGSYTIHIIDSNNCNAYKTIELENPDPIVLELGEDTTLCLNQDLTLNIQIDDQDASYLWESNFGFYSTNPDVSITEAGTYTATVTSSLGCVGSDTIIIETNPLPIDAEFLVTTQAFAEEDVILINTSSPIGSNVTWIIPFGVQIIEETNEMLKVRFDTADAYEIILQSTVGNCQQDYAKTIIVEEARDLPDVGDADTPFITEFNAFPNPNNGMFTVNIEIAEPSAISLRLYSLVSNATLNDRQESGLAVYSLDYNLNLAVGVYFLLLETPKGSEIRKIIIE